MSAEKWNRLFAEDECAFGDTCNGVVEMCLAQVDSGSVLDVGAGQGRNCIPFARKGLKVIAVDGSVVAMEQLCERAKQEGLPITTQVLDITDNQIEENYDVIICTFVLQCLTSEQAMSLIIDMQTHTKPGGFNVVALFIDEGDLYQRNKEKDLFYIHAGELKALYSEWHILHSDEKETELRIRKGSHNMYAEILAQKP